MKIEERHNPVVKQIGCRNRCFGRVELANGNLGIGVDERLLVDSANAFQATHVERILRAKVAGMCRLDFSECDIVVLLFFEGRNLGVRQDYAILMNLLFQSYQALLKGFQIASDPLRNVLQLVNKYSTFAKFVAGSDLAIGRELNTSQTRVTSRT